MLAKLDNLINSLFYLLQLLYFSVLPYKNQIMALFFFSLDTSSTVTCGQCTKLGRAKYVELGPGIHKDRILSRLCSILGTTQWTENQADAL